MKNKKLSIIIPVYNAEQWLSRCIESFIHQIDDRAEVLLVDDGSTDNSGSICDEYEGKYSYVIAIHQKNGGSGAARNMGMKHSTGEWLTFVDADDILAENFYELCLNSLNDDADVIIFDYFFIGEKIVKKEINEQYFYESDREQLVKNCFLGGGVVNIRKTRAVWGKLFCRAMLENNSIQFPEGYVHIGEDMIFMLAIYTCFSKIKYIPEKVYGYFFGNEQSITNKYKPDYSEMVHSYNAAIENYLTVHPKYEIYHMMYRLGDIIMQMKFNIFHKENTAPDSEKKKYLKKFIIEGGYKKYYLEVKRSGLIKNIDLKKRITFFCAIHTLYLPLKIIAFLKYGGGN